MKIRLLMSLLAVGLISACNSGNVENSTRGIGVYPGDKSQYFGPELVVDNTYRNLALHRMAYHSSSIDYNLTAQLVTDGIIASEDPQILIVSTQEGVVPKDMKEKIFDTNDYTSISFDGGSDARLQISYTAGQIHEADSFQLIATAICDDNLPAGYVLTLQGSNDGETWEDLGRQSGRGLPGIASPRRPERHMVAWEVKLPEAVRYSSYRYLLDAPTVKSWRVTQWNFYLNGNGLYMPASRNFESVWVSGGVQQEWVYVDLGASASIDKVTLSWLNKAEKGELQVSDDGKNWKKAAVLPGGEANTDEIAVSTKGRYVRVLMETPANGQNYALSEMEVYGTGALAAKPHDALPADGDKLYLSGGNWKLQRANLVHGSGEEISSASYDASDWIVATVPATVLSSYLNIGALPDPNYADNQLQISESFFNSNFWYRDEFDLPEEFEGKQLLLNFDGINWKANVYINGRKLGRIEGAFIRGQFDITPYIKSGESNVLAVEIVKNDHFGIVKEQNQISADINGGVLGYDNPTFHASIGWDWIPSIRGRNMGIWNDVYLQASSAGVIIKDPFVTTDLPLPSTEYADIHIQTVLENTSAAPVTGVLTAKYGEVSMQQEVSLAQGESRLVAFPAARLDNPKLWWPNGYGDHPLYDVSLDFAVDNVSSDHVDFKSGVREMSYTQDGGVLDIYINGRRLIGNGGNWGFSESNLNYREREYDIAVAYHADMNFTMIRNWVGQTGDQEFYEACDKYGIMVWQDFWLANPSDGPDPLDHEMFMKNAEDYVKRIRNHPSIALYVGRNEGNPPADLNDGFDSLVKQLHPGLFYIPHSASGLVSGYGPYRALSVKEYFSTEAGIDKLHSERGMPNVMTYESITRMLPEEHWWPQSSQWGMHDFTQENAQSCVTFNNFVETAFGESDSLEEFAERAQWINYDGYRTMFESRSWNRKGLIIWMSHSAWPSMVWQTYDYYFEPTAAYFGAKKGSAPIRIQWNPVSCQVEVVNNNASDQMGLTAVAQIYNYDGTKLSEKTAALDSKEDTTSPLFPLSFDIEGLADVYFIKLALYKGEELIADNFYWQGKEEGNYKLLDTLPDVKLKSSVSSSLADGTWTLTATVKNPSSTPALMIRLKVVDKASGERVLPVFYEDNYFFLMPGEQKTVTITCKAEDCHGSTPTVKLSGHNVAL